MQPYQRRLKPLARLLRGNMTDAEQLLWFRLRRKQILGVQFYRQKPLAGYIVDFYCATADLVVELDGGQHFDPEHQRYDQRRTKTLQAMGMKVLRFDNRQVLMELDEVLVIIFAEIEKKIPPAPFSKGGGPS